MQQQDQNDLEEGAISHEEVVAEHQTDLVMSMQDVMNLILESNRQRDQTLFDMLRSQQQQIPEPTYNIMPDLAKTIPYFDDLEKYLKEVKIGPVSFMSLIDTGSSCCTIQATAAIKSGLPIQPCKKSLHGFGNTENVITSLGRIVSDISMDSAVGGDVEMLVVPDNAQSTEVIIGRTWTELPSVAFVKLGEHLFVGNADEDPFKKLNLPTVTKDKPIKLRTLSANKLQGNCINFVQVVSNVPQDGQLMFGGAIYKPDENGEFSIQIINTSTKEKYMKKNVSTMGISPFEALLGYRPRHHDGALRSLIDVPGNSTYLPPAVRNKIMAEQLHQKAYFDKKRYTHPSFDIGEVVMMRRAPVYTGEPTKGQSKYRGSLVALKVFPDGNTYRVSQLTGDVKQKHYATTAHVSQLKSWGNKDKNDYGEPVSDESEVDRAIGSELKTTKPDSSPVTSSDSSDVDETGRDNPRTRPIRERRLPKYLNDFVTGRGGLRLDREQPNDNLTKFIMEKSMSGQQNKQATIESYQLFLLIAKKGAVHTMGEELLQEAEADETKKSDCQQKHHVIKSGEIGGARASTGGRRRKRDGAYITERQTKGGSLQNIPQEVNAEFDHESSFGYCLRGASGSGTRRKKRNSGSFRDSGVSVSARQREGGSLPSNVDGGSGGMLTLSHLDLPSTSASLRFEEVRHPKLTIPCMRRDGPGYTYIGTNDAATSMTPVRDGESYSGSATSDFMVIEVGNLGLVDHENALEETASGGNGFSRHRKFSGDLSNMKPGDEGIEMEVLNRDDCTSSSNIKYTSHATLEVGPERRRDHTDLTNVVTFPLSSFQERRLSRVRLVVKHPAPEAARSFVERMSELATIQQALEYSRETVAPIGYSEFVSVH
uniref:(California timema) hypothetical protein n=1 Tax=Timema californicum TaxID=61474 RepID=A0A7R9J151_TIMCA|nr:unnamed protein product [Timema californicum]